MEQETKEKAIYYIARYWSWITGRLAFALYGGFLTAFLQLALFYANFSGVIQALDNRVATIEARIDKIYDWVVAR